MSLLELRSRALEAAADPTSTCEGGRCVVVVPTYNEAESLPRLLEALAGVRATVRATYPIDVLVVDDGSPDGTADLVRNHPAYGEWLGLLARSGKGGLGAAYRAGFAHALDAGYDVVVQMDADGSHPVSALPAMFEQIRDHDLVIGSRYVRGGRTENWPLRRRVLSTAANAFARGTLWLRTHDATAGFRAWRSDALRAAGVLAGESDGYGFQVENTWRAERAGLRVAEHPITFVERTGGVSKMDGAVVREAIGLIARWRLSELVERTRRHAWVIALVTLGVLLRLPYLNRPLSPDESGFLMVARQWHPGASLYGDFWVDRPPLLVAIFQAADLAGGAVGLRVIGALAVAGSVGLAAWLGARVTSRRVGPIIAAAVAVVLLDSRLFGGLLVNGELLSVPLILAGVCCVLRAAEPVRGRGLGWWGAAGAAGMAAALIKQNMLDVFVVAGAVLLWQLVRVGKRRALLAGTACMVGAVAMAVVVLGYAAAHGTSPHGLWDAVVTFRLEAAAVISSSASPATSHRAMVLGWAWLGSGAPVLLAVAVMRRQGRVPDTRLPLGWLAGVLLVWEVIGVVAGGSYWLHYLVGTVPGTVLVVSRGLAGGAPVRRYVVALMIAATSLAAAGTATAVAATPSARHGAESVKDYLRTHALPGDTGVVAYGHAEFLEEAGLSSPYENLWSLPVRVRDPHLADLTAVLAGPDRPTWVVTRAEGLVGWGIDARAAEPVLDREYVVVRDIGDWRILHVSGSPATAATP
jgi:hypothetical protein